MTALSFVALALAGGIGAACRLLLDGVISSRRRGALPWGTIVINVTGSFLLGLVTGLATATVLPETWQLVVGTGFLGGYTTFSTASFETVRLVQERKHLAAVLTGLGTLVVTTALAGLGLWLGSLV
ncbi:camphor resistance protein CrcB [Salana multivorans]|uniref:Fluoride-specific ion channel FluC n=1 Tax=Salana multivorans TaxID=120377 RepID=A0A3N2DD36_9MICO|nr:fluoride efflux transporter CrcB [Salana multivorans]OJX98048.1 MAG: chromosome condensation protein CrcB [Micrococcales bacterium 73-15]ROR97700.1 camphor resistance protein CrcB [Salana multivorans]